MKKLLSVLLAALMIFTLAGCGNKGGEETGAKTVKVGVSIYKFDDTFMTNYRNEIDAYFKTKNTDAVTYQVDIMDGKNDMAEQTNQIDNFITQGYDVLILNLVQSSAAQTIVDKCAAAGIPCVFINREPAEDVMKSHADDYAGKFCYVGADARQSGKMQGEIIADLADKGDLNGDGTLQYVMIEGDPENVDAQYRTEFSISQYKEVTGMPVECLVDQVGNWNRDEGETIAANALTQFGDKIEVIFANNDDMADGALTAIKAAGRTVGTDIYLVGVDANDYAVADVLEGTFTGTVLNDAKGQSHAAVDCAIKAANGEALDSYYWVDYVKVTAANAADYQ